MNVVKQRRLIWLCAFGVLAVLLSGDAGAPRAVISGVSAAPAQGPVPDVFQAPVGAPPRPAADPTPTATPAPALSPEPTPQARLAGTEREGEHEKERRQARVRVPEKAKGTYTVVAGEDEPPGERGKAVRYLVEVERGLPFDAAEFAALVHRTLNDPRSWGAGGRMRFHRVDSGPVRFRVALSSPALTDRQCLPLRTGGWLSCWNGRRAVINAVRWAEGVPGYGEDLASYRVYVINHEVGHALGHGHQACPGRGRRAPVMAQQTKSLDGCRPNPWPFPDRRAR